MVVAWIAATTTSNASTLAVDLEVIKKVLGKSGSIICAIWTSKASSWPFWVEVASVLAQSRRDETTGWRRGARDVVVVVVWFGSEEEE